MPAMTMIYRVDSPDVFTHVQPGDRIVATVYDGDVVMLHGVRVEDTAPANTAPAHVEGLPPSDGPLGDDELQPAASRTMRSRTTDAYHLTNPCRGGRGSSPRGIRS
jgi:hypothetical protein